jgi:hypothetical protein
LDAIRKPGWKFRVMRAGLTAAVICLAVNSCYGPFWFYRDHVGWQETDVVRSLGPPDVDSRVIGMDKPGQPYTLGWYHGLVSNCRLAVHFSADGIARSEERDSK